MTDKDRQRGSEGTAPETEEPGDGRKNNEYRYSLTIAFETKVNDLKGTGRSTVYGGHQQNGSHITVRFDDPEEALERIAKELPTIERLADSLRGAPLATGKDTPKDASSETSDAREGGESVPSTPKKYKPRKNSPPTAPESGSSGGEPRRKWRGGGG